MLPETNRAPSILHKGHLADRVRAAAGLTLKESDLVIDTILHQIVLALERGETVELRRFGAFHTRTRKARTGRNPATGAVISVPAKRVAYFRPGKEIRDVLTGAARV
jgi:integration host factor subunit beta